MTPGQTYEHGDAQEIPPLDDRIADLAQKLCDDHRRILDQFCKVPERSGKLMALEAALRERRTATA
jgi:hypothetical protein